MRHRVLITALILTLACDPRPRRSSGEARHIAAAKQFTDRYANSQFARWKVRGSAAGDDCAVLLVETSMILEDSMVEALHYGAGVYAVRGGGVQRFCRDGSFRAVAYKDASARIWEFGLTADEAASLKPCR